MSENKGTQEKEKRKEMVLKVSDIDPKFKYEISKLPGAENVLLCFQCGTCTADCSIARSRPISASQSSA
jgi:heterodisulfide reductase subunit C